MAVGVRLDEGWTFYVAADTLNKSKQWSMPGGIQPNDARIESPETQGFHDAVDIFTCIKEAKSLGKLFDLTIILRTQKEGHSP